MKLKNGSTIKFSKKPSKDILRGVMKHKLRKQSKCKHDWRVESVKPPDYDDPFGVGVVSDGLVTYYCTKCLDNRFKILK